MGGQGKPRVKNRRPADDGCCGVHFLKYILFIFNFLFYVRSGGSFFPHNPALFQLTGLTVLGVGVWTAFWKSDYVALLGSSTFSYVNYVLMGAGASVLIVGVFGCLGVLRESRGCLLAFTFLLLLVFLAEAVGGVMAYAYSESVGAELAALNVTLQQGYGRDPAVTKAAEKLHLEHSCCGGGDFQDWRHSEWYKAANTPEAIEARSEGPQAPGRALLVPSMCCLSPSPDCGARDHPSNIHYAGCGPKLSRHIQRHEIIIGAIALGLSTIQIFGMIISCCLFVHLKDYADSKRHRDHYANSYY